MLSCLWEPHLERLTPLKKWVPLKALLPISPQPVSTEGAGGALGQELGMSPACFRKQIPLLSRSL